MEWTLRGEGPKLKTRKHEMTKEEKKFAQDMALAMACAVDIKHGQYGLYAEVCRKRHEKRVSYETWTLLRHASLHECLKRGIFEVKENA